MSLLDGYNMHTTGKIFTVACGFKNVGMEPFTTL